MQCTIKRYSFLPRLQSTEKAVAMALVINYKKKEEINRVDFIMRSFLNKKSKAFIWQDKKIINGFSALMAVGKECLFLSEGKNYLFQRCYFIVFESSLYNRFEEVIYSNLGLSSIHFCREMKSIMVSLFDSRSND